MEKVKYGIIGIGNMGLGHLKTFYSGKIANGECTAIADLNGAKIKAALKITIEKNKALEAEIQKAKTDIEAQNMKIEL